MSLHYLGSTIDIHGGGSDLVFPHHESEIVQSENYTGQHPFVRYWVHTAMVYYGGEKMSKSLGNLVLVSDLLKRYPADAVRVLLLSHHHTQPWSYDERQLGESLALAMQIAQATTGHAEPLGRPLHETGEGAVFLSAMEDDLDTPMALEALRQLSDGILQRRLDGMSLPQGRALLKELAGVLGLRLG